jgi:glutamine amidotransferase
VQAAGTIAVVDYGMGNLRSVAKALEHVAGGKPGGRHGRSGVVAAAERVVFPVRARCPTACANSSRARPARRPSSTRRANKPFLGICIGQQMLFEHSEEGDVPGWECFRGQVRRFPDERWSPAGGEKLKVPHMGWNEVRHSPAAPLWNGIADGSRFYFVHSYFVAPVRSCVAGTTDYGIPFTSAVARDNIFAVQCHPEKSAKPGCPAGQLCRLETLIDRPRPDRFILFILLLRLPC